MPTEFKPQATDLIIGFLFYSTTLFHSIFELVIIIQKRLFKSSYGISPKEILPLNLKRFSDKLVLVIKNNMETMKPLKT